MGRGRVSPRETARCSSSTNGSPAPCAARARIRLAADNRGRVGCARSIARFDDTSRHPRVAAMSADEVSAESLKLRVRSIMWIRKDGSSETTARAARLSRRPCLNVRSRRRRSGSTWAARRRVSYMELRQVHLSLGRAGGRAHRGSTVAAAPGITTKATSLFIAISTYISHM